MAVTDRPQEQVGCLGEKKSYQATTEKKRDCEVFLNII